MSDLIISNTDKFDHFRIIDSSKTSPVEAPGLSWGARGLHLYLITRGKDWKIYKKNLISKSKDGEKNLDNYLKELRQAGFLRIVQERKKKDNTIKWRWFVNSQPIYKFENEKDGGMSLISPDKQRHKIENDESEVGDTVVPPTTVTPTDVAPTPVTPTTSPPLVINDIPINDVPINELKNQNQKRVSSEKENQNQQPKPEDETQGREQNPKPEVPPASEISPRPDHESEPLEEFKEQEQESERDIILTIARVTGTPVNEKSGEPEGTHAKNIRNMIRRINGQHKIQVSSELVELHFSGLRDYRWIEKNWYSRVVKEEREERKRVPKRSGSKGNGVNGGNGYVPQSRNQSDKIQFAEFVWLAQHEYDTLVNDHGEEKSKKAIKKLNHHKGATGKKYQSDYHAIESWVIDAIKQEEKKSEGSYWEQIQRSKRAAAKRAAAVC